MQEYEISIGDLRDKFYESGAEELEYYDELTGKWIDLNTSIYFERNSGFPVPEKALEPINLMQIYDNKLKTLIILGLRDWKHQDDYTYDYDIKYIKCNDEIHMLQTYNKLFKKCDPLIIYAWYGAGFDFPYIHNRMKRLGIDTNEMSNYGDVKLTESEFQGKKEFRFSTDGHFYIDLMEVYKKFTFHPMVNYSLDTVAEFELKKNKRKHHEYAAFDDFYTGKYIIPDDPSEEQLNSPIYKAAIAGDWDEVKELSHSNFVDYGITDTYLLKELDEKKNFTVLMMMIAEKMGVSLLDSMGTVKPWSQYISNKSMMNNQVMPFKKDHGQPMVVGGYVREHVPGKLKWVLSGDVNSMYPLLGMVGFNMSPETFISKPDLPPKLRDIVIKYFNDQEEANRLELPENVWKETTDLLNEHNLALGINGAVFNKDKLGMIPEMVLDIYETRSKAKQTMFKYEQQKELIKEIIRVRENA